jgi:hypothetical protein
VSVNRNRGERDVDGDLTSVAARQPQTQRFVHLSGRRVFAALGAIALVHRSKTLGDQNLNLATHQVGNAKARKCLQAMIDVTDPSVVIDNDDGLGQQLEEVPPRKRTSLETAGRGRTIDQSCPTFT